MNAESRVEDGAHHVDASGAQGVQVGDQSTQINYFYNQDIALPPHVTQSGKIDTPYMGLRAFQARDAALFFGREGPSTKVLELISQRLTGPAGLLVVSGASGAGKSSLLHAGVLPRLRGGGLPSKPEASSWPCLTLSPARKPLEELALRVARLTGATSAAVLRDLADDPSSFALTAREAAGTGSPGRRLLLIVDQCEQLFTQCTEEDRHTFLTALYTATTASHSSDEPPAALAVLTIRADFETRLAGYRPHEYPLLIPAVQYRFLLAPMNEPELRMAITQPAAAAGSEVEDDLVRMLIEEMRAGPSSSRAAIGEGVLPLLSHALDQAWRHRAGPNLTLADYERAGGIQGAVAVSAQTAYDSLSRKEQDIARQVFVRLTATSDDGIDTAIAVARMDLYTGRDPNQAAEIDAVLDTFAAQRLITLTSDTVEISHEVLLTAWPLLRDTWLADTHEDRIVRTRLRAAAGEWERSGRDRSYLYSGSRLEQADSVAARIATDPRHVRLSEIENNFLSASRRAGRNRFRRRRAVIATLLVITLSALGATGAAGYYAANANQQHAVALSRQLAAESLSLDPTDPTAARQLAAAAWGVSPTPQAGDALVTLLTEQSGNGELPGSGVDNPVGMSGYPGTFDVAFSPDGRLLAAVDASGYIRVWNLATGTLSTRPWLALPDAALGDSLSWDLVFSPDDKLLATVDGNAYVRIWDVANGRSIGPSSFRTDLWGSPSTVAFSPDGKRLAIATRSQVWLWNRATGAVARRFLAPANTGVIGGVAYNARGDLLAGTEGNGYIRVWDVTTARLAGKPLRASVGKPLHPVRKGDVSVLAFNPGGTLLASFGQVPGGTEIWALDTGRHVHLPVPSKGQVTWGEAFSPDGSQVAIVEDDGSVRVWNTATGAPAAGRPLASAGTDDYTVAFSPDGRLLAGAGQDGYIHVLSVATANPLRGSASFQATTLDNPVALSPDGALLAAENSGGGTQFWDTSAGSPVGSPIPAEWDKLGTTGLAFDPGGKLLATYVDESGAAGAATLWDTATRKPVKRRLIPIGEGTAAPTPAVFSPNGRVIAIGSDDGSVDLWDTDTGGLVTTPHLPASEEPGLVGEVDVIDAVGFRSGGRLVEVIGSDGRLRTFDAATGRPAATSAPAVPLLDSEYGAAFSSDGRLVAGTAPDANLRIWDTATGEPTGGPLAVPHGVSMADVAFSPDGRLLAGVGTDGYVRFWDVATGLPVGLPLPTGAVASSRGDGFFFDGSWGADASIAFSRNGLMLAAADEDTVTTWQVEQFADPYRTLCAEVGGPPAYLWAEYAAGEPRPAACAGGAAPTEPLPAVTLAPMPTYVGPR